MTATATSDTYRYQGQVVTLVNDKDKQSTECTIRLPDGTEKTVSRDEITVEQAPKAAPAEEPEPKAG